VMLKASAGGGGRGMRIVYERSKLQSELGRATSEAARSFGSGDCILEKYIEAGKHIEIQIIGDSHGNVISLYDRECSIQRRHQKVIEETPSPWLSTLKRQEMSDVAVQIGQLLAYEGAGTVEFVVDVKDGKFYFLEVNTRLQVEHPITEEVTGLDIVSLQTFVAAGGSLASLPALQQVRQDGHAIECRLCAEDPQRDFFPEHGTIRLWQPAPAPLADSRDIRYETAVQTGSQISIYFDSMIAKIVVWAPTRSIAIEKMVKTLANTVCAGLRTNQLFLQSCLLHEKFRDPAYTTSFIPSHSQDLIKNPYHDRSSDLSAVLALIPSVFMRKAEHTLTSTSAARPFQHVRRGFRNQRFDPVNFHSYIVTITDPPKEQKAVVCVWKASRTSDTELHEVNLAPLPIPEQLSETQNQDAQKSAANELTVRYNAISNSIRRGDMTENPAYQVVIDRCEVATAKKPGGESWITASMDVSVNGGKIVVHLATETSDMQTSGATQMGQAQRLFCHFPGLGTWIDYKCYNILSFCESVRAQATAAAGAEVKTVLAPMPCKVLSILKQNGEEVKAGESVMVVESMKMEMNMSMAVDGKFQTKLKKGDAVNEGTLLCWVT
jgi:acetyl/propionyl-CoA carboxylase alpha subunit